MMVHFATTCDTPLDAVQVAEDRAEIVTCGARSAEYTCWPLCRECGSHVCPEHEAEGTREEDRGYDGSRTCLCLDCDTMLNRFTDPE